MSFSCFHWYQSDTTFRTNITSSLHATWEWFPINWRPTPTQFLHGFEGYLSSNSKGNLLSKRFSICTNTSRPETLACITWSPTRTSRNHFLSFSTYSRTWATMRGNISSFGMTFVSIRTSTSLVSQIVYFHVDIFDCLTNYPSTGTYVRPEETDALRSMVTALQ